MIERNNPTEQAANSDPSHNDAHSKPDKTSLVPEGLRDPILPSHSFRVTQEELRFYLVLVDAGRECIELRDRIVSRIERGASVEPGDLKPFINIETRLECTWKELRKAVGFKMIKWIKSRLQRTEDRRLRIRDSQGSIRGWGENRCPDRADP